MNQFFHFFFNDFFRWFWIMWVIDSWYESVLWICEEKLKKTRFFSILIKNGNFQRFSTFFIFFHAHLSSFLLLFENKKFSFTKTDFKAFFYEWKPITSKIRCIFVFCASFLQRIEIENLSKCPNRSSMKRAFILKFLWNALSCVCRVIRRKTLTTTTTHSQLASVNQKKRRRKKKRRPLENCAIVILFYKHLSLGFIVLCMFLVSSRIYFCR